ncbi:hypothetical protein BJF79_29145 [Actinomadura sp. CNU-125]|uniref:hypothetical protein n=1 Tax=Actinomadura sp. CNU-125 TaxID=1904961 RepID=UPI0009695DBA|nr:hypothetical protein [Actinomadura sp. CNU-125]OLT37667.1 hypothetical protein BJF79_29145 [Actinomadura sp. CNU-125]
MARLAGRVRWEPAAAPGVPAADAPGHETVALADGREVTGAVPCADGGADRPLGRTALLAKFEANVGGPADDLVHAVETLDAQPDAAAVLRAAAQAARTAHDEEHA